MSRPGANITGVAFITGTLGAKRVALLRQFVPKAKSIAMLMYPSTLEHDFARLVDSAPKVNCTRCGVEINVRMLVPVVETEEYRATYRCPRCGTDIQRQFKRTNK